MTVPEAGRRLRKNLRPSAAGFVRANCHGQNSDATTAVNAALIWAKVYDAVYIAATLAVQGSRLVTIDGLLLRGASRFVKTVTPSEM